VAKKTFHECETPDVISLDYISACCGAERDSNLGDVCGQCNKSATFECIDCGKPEPNIGTIDSLRYEIQTQYMGKYGIVFSEWSDELGETVSYPTRESARLAIEDLRELGDEWKQARYRVVEVKR